LKELGYERDKMVSYFRKFKQSEDCILFDGTDIFSASQQMDLPKLYQTFAIIVMAKHINP
jgi:hypothetical protein